MGLPKLRFLQLAILPVNHRTSPDYTVWMYRKLAYAWTAQFFASRLFRRLDAHGFSAHLEALILDERSLELWVAFTSHRHWFYKGSQTNHFENVFTVEIPIHPADYYAEHNPRILRPAWWQASD